jgi:tRNA (uracil-5-)-methyltransferase TRM9
MDPAVRHKLAEINRAFYAAFAGEFARTRQSWPPGFHRILPYLKSAANVVDVGCGNGRLLRFLAEVGGWRGSYLGVDASPGLLAVAAEAARGLHGVQARFQLGDLLAPHWSRDLRFPAPQAVAALAVLHHVPGAAARVRLLAECGQVLAPGGMLVVSTWQFVSAPRLRRLIQPWSRAGLAEQDVEPGDYLLSWGQGQAGLRYCAALGREALLRLAEEAGLQPVDTFYADGAEGDLNLYGVFSPA